MSLWIEKYDATGHCQFGFKRRSSTLDAVFTLETVARLFTMKKKTPLFSLMIDLKKAFPSVNRVKLIESLFSIGVPNRLCHAFASIFGNNSSHLHIDNSLSVSFPVNRGCREGSILSPDLFNLVYGKALNKCKIFELPENEADFSLDRIYYMVFADDLVLFGGDLKLLELKANKLSVTL